jgi:hypothetical protein
MIRRRPLLFVIAAIVLVLAVLLGLEVRWALTARADPTVDFGQRMTELTQERQKEFADQPNRWAEFRAALAAYQNAIAKNTNLANKPAQYPVDAGYPVDFTAVMQGRASAMVLASTDQTIAAIASDPAADFGPRLDALAGHDHFVRPMGGTGNAMIDFLLPELSEGRGLVRHELLAMQRAYRAGGGDRPGRVSTHLERVLLIARVLGKQGCLIDQVVAQRMYSEAYEEVAALFLESPPDREMLDAVAGAIERQVPGYEIPGLWLGGERCSGLDIIQRTFDSTGYGRGRFIATEGKRFAGLVGVAPALAAVRSPLQNMAWMTYASRSQTEEKLNSLFDQQQAYADATMMARRTMASPDTQVANQLPNKFAILQMFMPATGAAVSRMDLCQVQHKGLELVIAIERYRAEHGDVPQDVEALVPAQLTSAAKASVVSMGLVYRRLAEPDAMGRRYLVYHPGHDGVDDGGTTDFGTPTHEPDLPVLNARGSPGLDMIVNRPRRTK